MGIQFGDLVEPRKISLEELKCKAVAFDGHNVVYQFLSIIRGGARISLKSPFPIRTQVRFYSPNSAMNNRRKVN